jgi:hypothetical protein
MANELIIYNGLIIPSGSIQVTGSISVTGSVTGDIVAKKIASVPVTKDSYVVLSDNLNGTGNAVTTNDLRFDPNTSVLYATASYALGGLQGTTGLQGEQGLQGLQGEIGLQGDTGIQGEIGVQGTTGTQGIQGETGAQGETGIQGTTGDTGVGVQGTTGAQGIQGTTGTAGIGTQGTTGAQGTEGAQGIQGIQGIQGEIGFGIQGEQGITGDTGAQGITGTQGETGIQGEQGTQGTTGDTGIGTQGTTGAQGIQGISGVTTFPFTGSAIITGSLTLNGPTTIDTKGLTAGLSINGDTIGTIVLKTTGSSGFSITADPSNGFSIYDINDTRTRFYMSDSGGFGLNTTDVSGYNLNVSGSSRFTNNVEITGSLNVTNGITGSLSGTASYSTQALSASNADTLDGLDSTNLVQTSTDQNIVGEKSFRNTTFFGLGSGAGLDGKITFVDGTNDIKTSLTVDSEGNIVVQDASNVSLATIYQNGDGIELASGTFTGNLTGNADTATTASFASTASFVNRLNQSVNINGNSTITGSLTVTNNLIVLGSASFQFISQSTLNIGTNLITVNTFSPSARFGGLAIIDSGSNPLISASFLYDSVQDEFIFVHRGDNANITSSHFLVGPETYNNLGNETYVAANTILKSQGNEHVIGSNITDTGTLVGINSNTTITGSFTVTTGSNVELQVLNTGVRLGNISTDIHTVTGSLGISGSLNVSGNVVITGSSAPGLLVRGSGSATIATFQASDGLYRAFFGNTQHVVNTTSGGTFSIRPNEGTTNNPGFDFVSFTFGGGSPIMRISSRYTIGTAVNNAQTGLQFANLDNIGGNFRYSFLATGYSVTATSGTGGGIQYVDTFAAAAGSALYRPLSLTYTINNSGAQTGTTTGIFLNATETALNGMAHNLVDLQTGGISRFRITNTGTISTNTRISSSFNTAASGSTLTVIGSGSAQPIFTVQGSQGELFSVTDSLSGSLFSVNDISGLPIMEVFSDNTILMGDYQDPMLLTTKKVTQTNSGSFIIYSIPTASYDGAFIDYTIKSGSNARAGTIMSTWANSSIEFTEVDTMDIGSTSAVNLSMVLSGANAILTGSSSTGAWTIRTIIRAI